MTTRDPTLEEYLRIATIYTEGKLSEGQLTRNAEHYQQANYYQTITLGFLSYLRREFNLPIQFWPEILKLERKLSPLEIEALFLKEKIEREPDQKIRVVINGLE